MALAIKLGIALEGTVQLKSSFDRKHYYYADLPHGYQITQQREPIVRGGIVRCVGVENAREGDRDGGRTRRGWLTVGIERVQMETDTGKSQTVGAEAEAAQGTLVDLNRAGQALVEIVSEPDMRSGEDAAACVEALQRMLRYLHVSDANMEEGSLRCDVNVSVRTAEERERGVFGERVEIKNLNSLRSIVRAVKYEAKRHVDVLTAGGRIERETRQRVISYYRNSKTLMKRRSYSAATGTSIRPSPLGPVPFLLPSLLALLALTQRCRWIDPALRSQPHRLVALGRAAR